MESDERGLCEGQEVEILTGAYRGTKAIVKKNLDRRAYYIEVLTGKEYLYYPEEVKVASGSMLITEEHGQFEMAFANDG